MNDCFIKAIQLIESVGKQVLLWRTDNNIRRINSEDGFKTEADARASKAIIAGLQKIFPNVEVISEENNFHSLNRPDKYWLIDPIDGTLSWYHGYNGFVCQAAYIEKNVPIFGVIYAPFFHKTWSAFLGDGAYLNGKLLPCLNNSNRLIFSDNTSSPNGITKSLMSILPSTGYIESGSLGLKSVLVADGTIDLFVKDVCVRDWDLAPAWVILQEVGGCLMQITGDLFNFKGSYEKKKGFIVARDKVLMNSALDALKKINKV